MTPNNSPYRQRLESRSRRAFLFMVSAISAACLLMALVALVKILHQKAKPAPSVEEQLNDTLFKNHSEIPEDSSSYAKSVTRMKMIDSLGGPDDRHIDTSMHPGEHPNAEGIRRYDSIIWVAENPKWDSGCDHAERIWTYWDSARSRMDTFFVK